MQRSTVLFLFALALPGCSGSGTGDLAGGEAARAPERAGELWETDQAGDRAAAAASLVAFVHGMHVIVLDGDDLYAGATRRRLERGADGARSLDLPDSLQVQLAPLGDDVLELRFSTGERSPMRRRAADVAGGVTSR